MRSISFYLTMFWDEFFQLCIFYIVGMSLLRSRSICRWLSALFGRQPLSSDDNYSLACQSCLREPQIFSVFSSEPENKRRLCYSGESLIFKYKWNDYSHTSRYIEKKCACPQQNQILQQCWCLSICQMFKQILYILAATNLLQSYTNYVSDCSYIRRKRSMLIVL